MSSTDTDELDLPGTDGIDTAEDAVYSEPAPAAEFSVRDQLDRLAQNQPMNPESSSDDIDDGIQEGVSFPRSLQDEPEAPPDVPAVQPEPVSTPAEATPESVPIEQYQALMEQLRAAVAGQQAQAAQPAASVQPDPQAAPAQPVQTPSTQPYFSEANIADLDSPTKLNEIMLRVKTDAVREALQYAVPAAIAQVNYAQTINALVSDFAQANPDLAGVPSEIVGTYANEIQAQNPAWTPKQVFTALGDYTRSKLARPRTAAAVPARPAFAPAPAASPAPSNGAASGRESVRNTLRRMEALNPTY